MSTRGPSIAAQLAAAALALSGCATGAPLGGRSTFDEIAGRPYARPAPEREIPSGSAVAEAADGPVVVASGARSKVVVAAQGLVGQRRTKLGGKTWGDDCTGLVRGVYAQVGVDLMTAAERGDNGVTAIYRFAQRHGRVYGGGRPVAGDLVFFRDTYDLNRDGRDNDGLTHIGLVETIDEDGTVLVIHRVARGIVRYRMNLATPDQPRASDGRVINDALRAPRGRHPPQLASQLFAGFATLLPVESRFATLDR